MEEKYRLHDAELKEVVGGNEDRERELEQAVKYTKDTGIIKGMRENKQVVESPNTRESALTMWRLNRSSVA